MRIALLPALLLLVAPAAAAPSLRVGDKAPAISITDWVRGDAVDLGTVTKNKVVVVEFWATWCGPCIYSIPHLTTLQKKHADDIVVIGVTAPDARNSLDAVKAFVKEQGEKMAYTVAFDGDRKTYAAYMDAAEQRGIPTAFIVDKSGTLAWMGHPMQMDRPLEEIVAGTFDVELAAIKASLRNRVQAKLRRGDLEAVGRTLDALIALDPEDAQAHGMKFQVFLYDKKFEKAGAAAAELVEAAKDDEQMLNQVAWFLLTREGLKGDWNELALKAARRCHEISGGKNWQYLDTLALACFENGRKDEAAELQRKAIALAEEAGAPENQVGELRERLERFEQ